MEFLSIVLWALAAVWGISTVVVFAAIIAMVARDPLRAEPRRPAVSPTAVSQRRRAVAVDADPLWQASHQA